MYHEYGYESINYEVNESGIRRSPLFLHRAIYRGGREEKGQKAVKQSEDNLVFPLDSSLMLEQRATWGKSHTILRRSRRKCLMSGPQKIIELLVYCHTHFVEDSLYWFWVLVTQAYSSKLCAIAIRSIDNEKH